MGGATLAQIRKILGLLVCGYLFYVISDILIGFLLSGMDVAQLFGYCIQRLNVMLSDTEQWKAFMLTCVPPYVGEHLWYLLALTYALVLVWLLERWIPAKRMHWLLPLLLIWKMTVSPVEPNKYCPAYLFPALYYVLLGDFFYAHKEKLGMGKVFGAATIILALFLVGQSGVSSPWLDWMTTMWIAIALFLLAIQDLPFYAEHWVTRVARWGREYSMDIYIFHVLLIKMMRLPIVWLAARIPVVQKIYQVIAPLPVLLVSTMLAAVLTLVRKSRKKVKPSEQGSGMLRD